LILRTQALVYLLVLTCSLAACAVGPDYVPPAAPTPTTYKELKNWKVATPSDGIGRGEWWSFYRDPKLAFLIKQVEISNQTVAAAAASYEQARAVIRQAQAALLPTLTGSYTFTRTMTGPKSLSNQTGSTAAIVTGTPIYTTTYNPQLSASWDIDVWGKVRRQIESNAAAAQATAADLDNARLSQQALLATAYFNLLAADSLRDLLERTVKEYDKTLTITRNQYNAGYASGTGCCTIADVALAEALVLNTEAQAINVGVQRAQYEHAIAMLVGRPPGELTIGRHLLTGTIPKIPVVVPSTLLERRPDIAAAERAMKAQNAAIGVAVAAYYPTISLSAAGGFTQSPLNGLLHSANHIWSLGANGTETLFDFGERHAEVQAVRAAYEAAVASYRNTVLTAFEGVENDLSGLRILGEQSKALDTAVRDAIRGTDIAMAEFKAGTADYTTVAQAQAVQLSDQQTALAVEQSRLADAVSLIGDLGGGWSAADLHSPSHPKSLRADPSLSR